nr:57kD RNA-dependent RNA polymerase [Citrus tristeza virus]
TPPLLTRVTYTNRLAFGVVRSQAIPPRKASLQENLLSYESRNYNFIKTERFVGPSEFGRAMAAAVIERCFKMEEMAKIRCDIISLTEANILKWLDKRTPCQIKAVHGELKLPFSVEEQISNFKLMVKRDAKVKLDDSSLSKHPAAQNIMFHKKFINAIFSPCFDEFKNRVLSSLNDNIVFFTEMTNAGLAEIIRRIIGDDDNLFVGEVDFSKFDKSQDLFIKEYERTLYSEFGFDTELLDVWMEGEYRARATTLDGQLSFSVDGQRRSGGSNTWIGNSLVTLGILSLYYDVSKFDLLLVSGDDSLIYSSEKISNFSSEICLETGFETKFMSPSVPYFCSKFVVQTGNKTCFVPDPYKLLVKLGAPQNKLTDVELFELFTSFKDMTQDFGDQVVLEKLKLLVEAKYGFASGTTMPALCAIHCVRSNFLSFERLFPFIRGWYVVDALKLRQLRKLTNLICERVVYDNRVSYFSYFDNPFTKPDANDDNVDDLGQAGELATG